MPKSNPQPWVKNVYKPLFIVGKSWKKSVELFTGLLPQGSYVSNHVGNSPIFPTVTRGLFTPFYTATSTQITLVDTEFYPLSTGPTITTTKGKRR